MGIVAKLKSMFQDHGHQEVQTARSFHWSTDDVLGLFANNLAAGMTPEHKAVWFEVLHIASNANGGKPTKTFLKKIKAEMGVLPSSLIAEKLAQLFSHTAAQKPSAQETIYYQGTQHEYRFSSFHFISEFNINTLRGLVWAAPLHLNDNLMQALVKLADRCFKKIPGKGYTAGGLGNAVLWVLADCARPEAIAFLSKLKLKNIQANTKSLIDSYLQSISQKIGLSLLELEEMHIPDFGLDKSGKYIQYFDDYRAEVQLLSIGKTSIEWYKPDGKPQKSMPAAIKDGSPEAAKKLVADAKELATSSTAQRDRLDRMLRIERKFPFEHFEKTMLQHGLMGWLSKRLIWTISCPGQTTVNAFFTGESWRDSYGQKVDCIGGNCTLQLWHPAGSPTDETLRWRAFLEDIQLVQPMKQAFREIYLLTDAELRTRTYSNRFAAHLLKQSQFAMLARMRGWRYALLGAYDDGRSSSLAVLDLPEKSLRAEYWVSEVNADDAMNDSGIWHYIATDQVRFYQHSNPEPINLVDVPPIVLSEVLRDADLFVGVASVGNDPGWSDSGGLPGFRDYWQTYSFGDLSEMAKSRRDILTRLLPRLKIAAVSEMKDRFLVVRGKLRTYKIHLGSGNILMEPNDQYLCIVPDRKADTTKGSGNLFLPFEGDTGLSLILSKAFLLADDDTITDTTIISQIKN